MALYTDPSPIREFGLTGNATIDALFEPDPSFRLAWSTKVGGVTQISYSFPYLNGVKSVFASGYGNGENLKINAPSGVTISQAAYIAQAFAQWADVANIAFTPVTETASGTVGDIRVAFTKAIGVGYWGYTLETSDGGDNSHGDIWIDTSIKPETFAPYTYDFMAMMHEIGHALGLKHPFEAPVIAAPYDNRQYTIMSYTDPANAWWYNTKTGQEQYTIITPMVYDIAAVQAIYGANMTWHTGNDVYKYSPSQPFYATIWDAGGNDTIDVTAFVKGCVISLVAGSYSELGFTGLALDNNLGIAFGATIENADGGKGADTITGNDVGNVLRGNGGKDTISGGAGDDQLFGGAGADTLRDGDGNDLIHGDGGNDTITAGHGNDRIFGGAGDDTITIVATGKGGANKLFGGDGNDTIHGGTGKDAIFGGAGNDTIEGGGGHDVLTGGAGADRFVFPHAEVSGLKAATCPEITDFNAAQGDHIVLDWNPPWDPYAGASVPSNTTNPGIVLHWIGTAAFDKAGAELRYEVDGSYALLEADANGDGKLDFMVRLDGVTSLSLDAITL